MRAVYFIQETKNADLTMRQQQLLCLRAARRLRWYCCEAVFAEAGTEAASLALRPGMQELLRSAADGEFDVLLIVDAEHLFCSPAEIECLLSTLLRSGVPGSRTIGGTELFDLRTRIRQTVRFA